MVIKKLELQDLKNLGVGETALNIFSDSDFTFFIGASGRIDVFIKNECLGFLWNSKQNVTLFLEGYKTFLNIEEK